MVPPRKHLQRNIPPPGSRREILYEGYFYDVTDFIQRHPGGEEILEYHTLPGEDATLPFQQFHNRNLKQVLGMLKSFKKRPAPPPPLEGESLLPPKDHDPKSLRNKAMTEDFLHLFRELQEEGLFEPSYSHVAYRLLEPILLTLAGALVLTTWNHPLRLLVGPMLLGLVQFRAGVAMHEGGHHSLTGIPKVDRFLQSALIGVPIGMSAAWWRLDHNQHHAMTNRLHHDVDIEFAPLLAINMACLEDIGRPNFIMRYQKYFLPINAVIGYFYWRLWYTPTTLIKHPHVEDVFFIGLHYALSYQFMSLPVYILASTFSSWCMWANVSLGHSFLPVRDEPCHWVEAAIRHSSDVEHRPWCDWWMGYLNYQIEHHLFPTMPQRNNKLAVERVKALAAKYDLPYNYYSYWDAGWKAVGNMMEVENEMKKM